MFHCKQCEDVVQGEHTVSQIMAVGKLCDGCISTNNVVALPKKKPKKYTKRSRKCSLGPNHWRNHD